MSIQNLLNQFMGSSAGSGVAANSQGVGATLSKLAGNLPGGLAGGAAAGGIMALLVGSKSARKFAGTAAGYGGAALLGGLAYQAYKNWSQNNDGQATAAAVTPPNDLQQVASLAPPETLSAGFQLRLIMAMIAAARADGHIDAAEQQRIFDAVEQMDLSQQAKAVVFDLLRKPIAIEEIANGVDNMEQKSELYLAACLVIDPDELLEQAYLEQLAAALRLPQDLAQQLQWQARQAVAEAA